MSLHKDPKYQTSELIEALRKHGLPTDTPSQLADVFRCGWISKESQPSNVMYEIPDDVITHRLSWRSALELAIKATVTKEPDMDDKSYWQHEINVFDKTFDDLKSLKDRKTILPGYSHWAKRIEALMKKTAYPDSLSVMQALQQLCNEMMQAIAQPPKNNEVSLTRDYKDTILERIKCDPEFVKVLFQETVKEPAKTDGC